MQSPSTQINSDGNIWSNGFDNKGFLLDFSDNDSESESDEPFALKTKSTIPLALIIEEHKDQYFLHAIPEGRTFQCVMKRERTEEYLSYHLYDSVTLRNFLTIVKDEDYLVISKY
jgi:hypothetical protein